MKKNIIITVRIHLIARPPPHFLNNILAPDTPRRRHHKIIRNPKIILMFIAFVHRFLSNRVIGGPENSEIENVFRKAGAVFVFFVAEEVVV